MVPAQLQRKRVHFAMSDQKLIAHDGGYFSSMVTSRTMKPPGTAYVGARERPLRNAQLFAKTFADCFLFKRKRQWCNLSSALLRRQQHKKVQDCGTKDSSDRTSTDMRRRQRGQQGCFRDKVFPGTPSWKKGKDNATLVSALGLRWSVGAEHVGSWRRNSVQRFIL